VEVFGGGAVATLEDFRYLELVRHGRKKVTRAAGVRTKDTVGEMQAFIDAVSGSSAIPISFEQIVWLYPGHTAIAEFMSDR